MAVRAYQTASPLCFTSTMRGGIHVLYPGEREYHVLTDEEWHAYEVSNFHQSYEPKEWTTMDYPGRAGREERSLCCCEIHPRLLRRSPITDNDIQFGERYDARMEVKEWDGAMWVPVEAREISPEEKRLIYQNYPPVRRTCRLAPVSSRMLNEKCILYDFGVNIVGKSHVVMRNCGCGDVIGSIYWIPKLPQ